jgi:membrane protein required for colicin V production
MAGIGPVDIAAFAVLLLAALRGMALGMIREVFSLGALAAAVIAVRVWNEPFAHWLQRASGNTLPAYLVPWLAGVLLAAGVVLAVATFGRVMRQGARAAGLGFLDRVGGAALGAAEGAIAAGVLLFVIGGVLGRSHVLLATSRSYALLERAQQITAPRSEAAPDVAAPPAGR